MGKTLKTSSLKDDPTVYSVCVCVHGACLLLLTVNGVVADNMVSSTPIPQQKCCIPGPRDDVAVSSNVRL